MGSYKFYSPAISWDGMDPGFLKNKVLPFIAASPVDLVIYSAYRSIDPKQLELYNNYLFELDRYNKGLRDTKPSVVNRPGNSSHNWGFGVDAHPATYADADYAALAALAPKFGLKRDKLERWHYQDDQLTFEIMASWFKNYTPGAAGPGSAILIILIFGTAAFLIYKKYLTA